MKKAEASKDKNQRIQVFARCRPISSYERKHSQCVVELNTERKEVKVCDGRMHNKCFVFDKVFDPDMNQVTVYKAVVGPLIKEVLMGYNCTVFAYGQTGTGKTYTMEGERSDGSCSWEDDPSAGIIPRSLHQLFDELTKEENVEFSVHVSFLELYNEELFDLLSQTEWAKLRLFEDSARKGSVVIQGLEEIKVNTKDEVYAILEQGSARRQKAATQMNATSSRSHTVFSVTVHIKENTIDGEELLKTGKLNLVDLAGSENINRSGATQKTAREAGNINQSLLTLGRVITALVEKAPHIPYRESKLTRLLQDSLGGHTKTSIIATVSPAQSNIEETISTLDYAQRAKNITIKPEINQKMTKKALIKEYTEEIERLRKDIVAMRDNTGFYIDQENYNMMHQKICESNASIADLENKLDTLVAQKEKIENLFEETQVKLKETEEELNTTTKKYTETTDKLNTTTKKLETTKETLTKTTLEKFQQKYIVQVQNQTERELLKQAESLLKAADESSDHNHALHNKIARKQNVEDSNKKKSWDFRSQLQKGLVELEESASSMTSQHVSVLDSLESSIENILQLSSVQTELVQNSMKQLVDSNDLCLKSQLDYHKSEMESLVKRCDSNIETADSHQQEQLLKQQKFNEFILAIMDTLKTKLGNVHDQLQTAMETVSSKVEQVRLLTEQAHVAQKLHIEKVMKEFDLCISKNQTAFTNLENLESSSYASSLDDTKYMKEMIAKFSSEMISNLQARSEKSASKRAKHQEEIAIASERIKSHLSISNSDRQAMSCSLDDIGGKQNNALLELNTYQSNNTQELQEIVKDVSKDFEEHLKNTVSEFTAEVETDTKGTYQRFETAMSFEKKNAESQLKQFENHLKNQQSLVAKVATEMETGASEHMKAVSPAVSEHKAMITSEISSHARNLETIKMDLLDKDTQVEKFVSEVLVEDIPTGTTPMRKTYDYPQKLVPVLSPDKILENCTHLQSYDSIPNYDLLNTSFDDDNKQSVEDDKPSAPKATTPEPPRIVELVVSSEESGHESDSSVSSYSDASCKSERNKENHPTQITSSIPKMVNEKRRKKFLKPKQLGNTRRLPLYSSNECLPNEK